MDKVKKWVVDLADPITYMKLHNEAVRTRDPLGA